MLQVGYNRVEWHGGIIRVYNDPMRIQHKYNRRVIGV
jgi:hypothetical protein